MSQVIARRIRWKVAIIAASFELSPQNFMDCDILILPYYEVINWLIIALYGMSTGHKVFVSEL